MGILDGGMDRGNGRIPSPTPAERERYREQERIRTHARAVSARADTLAETLSDSSVKILLKDFAEYLKGKSSTNEYEEINRRAKFIEGFLNIFTDEKLSEADKLNSLEKYLSEKNIKPFKGIFSSKLYDIAKKCQFFTPQVQQDVLQAILATKKSADNFTDDLLAIVGDYHGYYGTSLRKKTDMKQLPDSKQLPIPDRAEIVAMIKEAHSSLIAVKNNNSEVYQAYKAQLDEYEKSQNLTGEQWRDLRQMVEKIQVVVQSSRHSPLPVTASQVPPPHIAFSFAGAVPGSTLAPENPEAKSIQKVLDTLEQVGPQDCRNYPAYKKQLNEYLKMQKPPTEEGLREIRIIEEELATLLAQRSKEQEGGLMSAAAR